MTNEGSVRAIESMRDLKFALSYDGVFVIISLIGWYLLIRPARKDSFRPNPMSREVGRIDDEQNQNTQTEHWIKSLWKWNIKDYASTDVYLYLLFQRNCSVLFFTISILTMLIGFPVIWTAGPYRRKHDGELIEKTFFERATITNVSTRDFFRLWILYGLVWMVFCVGIVMACIHYKAVRSDEFRAAIILLRKKNLIKTNKNRFFVNKRTIAIHGYDRCATSCDDIQKALKFYFEECQIVAVHLVMDYYDAFECQDQLKKAQNKISKLDRKIEALEWGIATGSFRLKQLCCSRQSRGIAESNSNDFPDGGALSDRLLSSDETYEPCQSIPATPPPTLQPVIERKPSEKVGKFRRLSLITLDSGILSPKRVNVRPNIQPAPLSSAQRRQLEDLMREKLEVEAELRVNWENFEKLVCNPPKRNVGTVFVSFASWEAARFALTHDLAHPGCPVFRSAPVTVETAQCFSCGISLQNQNCRCGTEWKSRWRIREAPPPEDIVWRNMRISRIDRGTRLIAVNFAIFLLLFALTSSAAATAMIPALASNVESLIAKASFLNVSLSGWLAPLILYMINALLLPFLVSWGANASVFWRRSSRDRAVLYANIHYMVINSLVFPVLGTSSMGTVWFFFTRRSVSEMLPEIGSLVAGASGSFVLRYLINTTCINSSMQLLQIPMFSQQRVLMKLGNRASRWDFDYGFWYAFHLAVFAVCIVFAVDFPIVPFVGGIFFGTKFWVDKYNLSMRVWRTRSECAGAVASSAVSFIFYFLAMFMLLMAGYFFAVVVSGRNYSSSKDDIKSSCGAMPCPRADEYNSLSLAAAGLALVGLLVFLVSSGEKAQRSFIMLHISSLRKLSERLHVQLARGFNRIGISNPARGITSVQICDNLSSSKLDILSNAYKHPYEKEAQRLAQE